MTVAVDFFFNFGSTYGYLTVMRLEAEAASHGVSIRWRPFNVRKLFVEQNNIPFPVEKAAKVAYMWRDIERRAADYGLDWAGVPPYPVDRSGIANRLGVIGGEEGWGPAFTRAAYVAWFIGKQDFGEPEVVRPILTKLGLDSEALIARADSDETRAKFSDETDLARALGIFGVPTFVTADRELFWGHDRLSDALTWAKSGHRLQQT